MSQSKEPEEYEKCLLCGRILSLDFIALDIAINIELMYCPNNECARYLLYTKEQTL